MGEQTSSEYRRASLVNDITRELESVNPLSSREPCIYKVPDPLRKMKEEAYTPQVISIGPFHHGNQRLQTMEKYKVRYLKEFLERSKINLENLLYVIEESEECVRQYYAETITLNKNDFVKMILTDASFIIELFFRHRLREWTSDDMIVLKPWLTGGILMDFFLLENQLPFFIIEKLFDLAFPSSQGHPSFFDLTLEYFHSYKFQKLSSNSETKIMHFLDLLRRSYLPPPKSLPTRNPQKVEYMYSATQLDEVGLKLRVNRSTKCLCDLQYEKGVLKIPRLILDDCTERYARNLIAFEQCHCPNEAYVTDYYLLLHFVIECEKDIDLLSRKGIVVNGLGNNDATFINNLSSGIIYSSKSSNYYYDLCNSLKKFYENPSHGWLASLRRDYFGTPWKIASTTAAVILLIFTLIQTVCPLIPVKPDH